MANNSTAPQSSLDIAPEDQLISLIKNQQYISLATCSDNTPLSTTLFFSFGHAASANGKYALYWLSDPKSKHSKQIKENPKASATLYDQAAPQGTGFGLRFKGTVKKLTLASQDAFSGYYLLKDKADNFPETIAEVTGQVDSIRRLYMMEINHVSANGAVEFEGKSGWKDFSHRINDEVLRLAASNPYVIS